MFYIVVLLFVITVIVCGSIIKKGNGFENFATRKDEENEREINRQINYCNSLINKLNLSEPITITKI